MSLKAHLVDIIKQSGPVSIAHYMQLCLTDPDYGYYQQQQPFGKKGDFVTAPEISQMFGELIGAWMVDQWQRQGCPSNTIISEIGPGRGTLMADMLRCIHQIAPELCFNARICLIETSTRLISEQSQALDKYSQVISWHNSLADLPDGPLFLVGNEFLDAVPVHQWIYLQNCWHNRVIGLNSEQELVFGIGPPVSTPQELNKFPAADEGAIYEMSPAREAFIDRLSLRLYQGGAALLVDYGHLEQGLGDTLQAVKGHTYVDVLATPGEADLTSHVDFAVLRRQVLAHNRLTATLETQGAFLLRHGLLERAGALGRGRCSTVQDEIRQAVERLAGDDQMGSLFKVMAIAPDN